MKTIRVRVDRDGTPTVSVEGVAGSSCKDLTAALERRLGKPESTTLTSSYWAQAVDQTTSEVEHEG